MQASRWMGLSVLLLTTSPAWAFLTNKPSPVCQDMNHQTIAVNTQQVLAWKTQTPNQFRARGFIEGILVSPPTSQGDHFHFLVQLSPNPQDVVEIILNEEFGTMPPTHRNMKIRVCGDYITSNAKANGFPASPAGALIHWSHYNPATRDQGRHPHGFIQLQDETGNDKAVYLVGFDQAQPQDWQGGIDRSGVEPTVPGVPNHGGNGHHGFRSH